MAQNISKLYSKIVLPTATSASSLSPKVANSYRTGSVSVLRELFNNYVGQVCLWRVLLSRFVYSLRFFFELAVTCRFEARCSTGGVAKHNPWVFRVIKFVCTSTTKCLLLAISEKYVRLNVAFQWIFRLGTNCFLKLPSYVYVGCSLCQLSHRIWSSFYNNEAFYLSDDSRMVARICDQGSEALFDVWGYFGLFLMGGPCAYFFEYILACLQSSVLMYIKKQSVFLLER